MANDTEWVLALIRALAIPGLVVVAGVVAALRGACSRAQLWRRFAVVAVIMALTLSAATSLLNVPLEQRQLRPGNPYPVGIGGVVFERDLDSGFIIDLFSH